MTGTEFSSTEFSVPNSPVTIMVYASLRDSRLRIIFSSKILGYMSKFPFKNKLGNDKSCQTANVLLVVNAIAKMVCKHVALDLKSFQIMVIV